MLKCGLFFACLFALAFPSALYAQETPKPDEAAPAKKEEKQAIITPKAAEKIMEACHEQKDNISAMTVGNDTDPDAIKAFYKDLQNGSVQSVVVIVSPEEMKMCDRNNAASGVKCRPDRNTTGEIIRTLRKKAVSEPSLNAVIAMLRLSLPSRQ